MAPEVAVKVAAKVGEGEAGGGGGAGGSAPHTQESAARRHTTAPVGQTHVTTQQPLDRRLGSVEGSDLCLASKRQRRGQTRAPVTMRDVLSIIGGGDVQGVGRSSRLSETRVRGRGRGRASHR